MTVGFSGESIWRRLIKEGGFVWTRRDGSKSVKFNRGCRPSRELREMLLAGREALAAYVDERHRLDAEYEAKLAPLPRRFRLPIADGRPPGSGPSGPT